MDEYCIRFRRTPEGNQRNEFKRVLMVNADSKFLGILYDRLKQELRERDTVGSFASIVQMYSQRRWAVQFLYLFIYLQLLSNTHIHTPLTSSDSLTLRSLVLLISYRRLSAAVAVTATCNRQHRWQCTNHGQSFVDPLLQLPQRTRIPFKSRHCTVSFIINHRPFLTKKETWNGKKKNSLIERDESKRKKKKR